MSYPILHKEVLQIITPCTERKLKTLTSPAVFKSSLRQSGTVLHSESFHCEWPDGAGRSTDGAQPHWWGSAFSVNQR